MSHQRAVQTNQQTTTSSALASGVLQRKCACGQHTVAGGECTECRQKRLSLLHRVTNQNEPANESPIVHDVLRSPGRPLDLAPRTFMEHRFGHDFSQVRVHTDAKAVESARAVNALAYTVGKDIVFGADRYTPGTSEGRRLLAHELTHVIQQGGTENAKPMLQTATTSPGDRFEAEADRASLAVTSGERVHISNRLGASEEMIARVERGDRGDCPSVFEITLKCGLALIGCVAATLAGMAITAGTAGLLVAAAILGIIAACGGAGVVCGELLTKYYLCRGTEGLAELESPAAGGAAEAAV